jgi:hypothetical protein
VHLQGVYLVQLIIENKRGVFLFIHKVLENRRKLERRRSRCTRWRMRALYISTPWRVQRHFETHGHRSQSSSHSSDIDAAAETSTWYLTRWRSIDLGSRVLTCQDEYFAACASRRCETPPEYCLRVSPLSSCLGGSRFKTILLFVTKGYIILYIAWAGLTLLVKLHILHQKQSIFGELGIVPEHSPNRHFTLWSSGTNFFESPLGRTDFFFLRSYAVSDRYCAALLHTVAYVFWHLLPAVRDHEYWSRVVRVMTVCDESYDRYGNYVEACS